MPWHRRPSSLKEDYSQLFWYLVWCWSWRYYRDSPVSALKTGMDRETGGCAFFVWDLVRRAMVWSGAVSLGFTIGGGAGKWCWIITLGAGSHSAGLLSNLGVGWCGMWFCSLGCLRIIFCTLIDQQFWAVEGNGTVAVGAGVLSGDWQLAEASHRAALDWS